MKQYGIGILGYGGFGQFLHQSWNQMEQAHVVAIADMQEVNPVEPDVSIYNDLDGLLNDQAVDIVSICTPPNTHHALALQAMKAGKHVLVEKPLALAKSHLEEMIQVRNDSSVVAAVNHMLRFNPLIEMIQGWNDDFPFGTLRHAAVENFAQDEELPVTHWFWDSVISGGILVEHAVHFIDLVNWIADRPVADVQGMTRFRNPEQQDQVLASITYDNGLIATHYHEFSGLKAFEQTHIRLDYELAHIELEGWIPLAGKVRALINDKNESSLQQLPGWTETARTSLTPSGELTLFKSADHGRYASHIVDGAFALPDSKLNIYAECLRGMMSDIIGAIEKGSNPRASLEIGAASVDVALKAVYSDPTEHPSL